MLKRPPILPVPAKRHPSDQEEPENQGNDAFAL